MSGKLSAKKSASARLAAYVLRPAKQGGSVLPRKAAVLTEHSYEGDKGNTVSWGLQDAGQFGVAIVVAVLTELPLSPMLTYRTEVGVAH
ncbi:hypothetical protein F3157_20455 [Virgibacillus dakarensis]|nr:hypothetical protein [Virgibacillus dakarensis]